MHMFKSITAPMFRTKYLFVENASLLFEMIVLMFKMVVVFVEMVVVVLMVVLLFKMRADTTSLYR